MDQYNTPAESKTFSLRSMASFLVIGGVATAIHYSVAAVLAILFLQPIVTASAVGFTVSAIINYFLNAKLTFRSTQPHAVTAPWFFLTAGVGLLLNSILLSLFALKFNPVIAQLLTTIGVMTWNYSINGLWTFKKRANQERSR